MEGDSLLSKVLPGNPAEAAGKLGEGAMLDLSLRRFYSLSVDLSCHSINVTFTVHSTSYSMPNLSLSLSNSNLRFRQEVHLVVVRC